MRKRERDRAPGVLRLLSVLAGDGKAGDVCRALGPRAHSHRQASPTANAPEHTAGPPEAAWQAQKAAQESAAAEASRQAATCCSQAAGSSGSLMQDVSADRTWLLKQITWQVWLRAAMLMRLSDWALTCSCAAGEQQRRRAITSLPVLGKGRADGAGLQQCCDGSAVWSGFCMTAGFWYGERSDWFTVQRWQPATLRCPKFLVL